MTAGIYSAAVLWAKSAGPETGRPPIRTKGRDSRRPEPPRTPKAAVWREAIHLVQSGVASVGDVDKAMSAGPGLRWAGMGPTALFSLGAGPGGLPAFCDHFAETFNGWWASLGSPQLTPEVSEMLANGLAEATGDLSVEQLAAQRDAKIVKLQRALAEMEKQKT